MFDNQLSAGVWPVKVVTSEFAIADGRPTWVTLFDGGEHGRARVFFHLDVPMVTKHVLHHARMLGLRCNSGNVVEVIQAADHTSFEGKRCDLQVVDTADGRKRYTIVDHQALARGAGA